MGHRRTLTSGLGPLQSPLWMEAELGPSWLVSLAPSSGTFVMGTGKRGAGYPNPKVQGGWSWCRFLHADLKTTPVVCCFFFQYSFKSFILFVVMFLFPVWWLRSWAKIPSQQRDVSLFLLPTPVLNWNPLLWHVAGLGLCLWWIWWVGVFLSAKITSAVLRFQHTWIPPSPWGCSGASGEAVSCVPHLKLNLWSKIPVPASNIVWKWDHNPCFWETVVLRET